MYTDLSRIECIAKERRNEAGREAAHWRLIRTLPGSNRGEQAILKLWRHIHSLARIRERHTVRARLREYVAR
jgi:hypothetical protein